MPIPTNLLQNRRQKLAEQMANSSLFILFSNQIVARNADVDYPFRQNSSFWYLTGIDEDSCILLIKKDGEGGCGEKLFIQQKTHSEEIWTGKVNGIERSKILSAVEEIGLFGDFMAQIENWLKGSESVYLDLFGSYQNERNQILNLISGQSRRKWTENINNISKTDYLLRQLRMYKDAWEIEQMQIAAKIATQAHILAMQKVGKNAQSRELFEYEVEADLYHVFKQNNCNWSYPAIVAGGKNACILHYNANNDRLNPSDLLLIDAGCEHNYYASDITRTFPISGKFSAAQKEIYNLVLKANLACIEELQKPTATYLSYHQKSVEVLTEGLLNLGLLKGNLGENIEQKSYLKYYMHGVGHYLGLDVHDLGIYLDSANKRSNQPILEGMALTVEPGLYFDSEDESIPKEYRGIGVRIEDDVIKTAQGLLNLTANCPKSLEEVENCMS